MPDLALSLLRFVSRWLFWPAVALIVWGELTPAPPPALDLLWDKAEHFIAYFGLAAMATLALGLSRRLIWAIAGILLLGIVLEVLQHFTGRDPDIRDVIANVLGTMAGLSAAAVFATLVEKPAEDYPGEG
ncbi:MAG TPA: VanZ family protein [Rhizomicrobium sp.]|jgi:VanZ family protein|nr:VanZ family protein [Rhizomicrobium sp.]